MRSDDVDVTDDEDACLVGMCACALAVSLMEDKVLDSQVLLEQNICSMYYRVCCRGQRVLPDTHLAP